MIKNFLSFLYSLFSSFYFFLYDKNFLKKHSLQKLKILSIGNLRFGGTGKTPMVSFVSSVLHRENINHVIVSRGYKRLSKKLVVVSDGKTLLCNVKDGGDESLVLYKKNKKTPIIVGNKIACCEVAKNRFFAEVVVVDDGFQSHYIKKNIEVVLIDVSVPYDDYCLFPLGNLREPISSLRCVTMERVAEVQMKEGARGMPSRCWIISTSANQQRIPILL